MKAIVYFNNRADAVNAMRKAYKCGWNAAIKELNIGGKTVYANVFTKRI